MGTIDRRQFVIMNTPYVKEDFINLKLSNGMILSYQKELKITVCDDNVLLGHAFSTEPEAINLKGDMLPEMAKWSGRWVLLTKDKLYLDACGTLGCYYGEDSNGFVISSSLRIISEALNKTWTADYKVKHGDGNGIVDYYPIPYTPYDGIMKLLPSQYIEFDSKLHIKFRDNYMINRYCNWTIEDIQNAFIEKMSNVMKNIEHEFPGEVWITLTGGVDSRTNFAIAYHSGIKFKAYTAVRNNVNKYDLKWPKIICKKMKIPYFHIDDTKGSDKALEDEFDIHCGGPVTFGTERQQYAANSDVPSEKKAIVLWGTLWALSFECYERYINDALTNEEKFDELKRICGSIMEESNIHNKSFKAWLKNDEENPYKLGWRKRMYWEQRNGAWVSAAQQGIDLFDSVRISPVNSQELFELLFSYPKQYQRDKRKQKDIINICCPKIRRITYGEPNNIFYRIIRKLKRMI